jgi:hypothetical protein
MSSNGPYDVRHVLYKLIGGILVTKWRRADLIALRAIIVFQNYNLTGD